MEEIKFLRELMHEAINTYGITSEVTLEISQQLDLLILKEQKKVSYRYNSWYKSDRLVKVII